MIRVTIYLNFWKTKLTRSDVMVDWLDRECSDGAERTSS